jgi:hypothetical protein
MMGTKYIATRFHFTLTLFSLLLSGSSWASTIDAMVANTPGSVGQPQSTATETSPPSPSEEFLKQVRVNSRRQAAGAAFNLSVIAAGRNDFTSARSLIEELHIGSLPH